MADFINTIDVIGDDALADSIISRNIIEYKDNIVTSIGRYALASCTNLTSVDFPVVTSVGSSAFYGCSKLNAVILRKADVICTLSSTNALADTSIASGTGYIYVPKALLSDDDATKDYRRASNWSNFASQFRALENFTVDGTITGELDMTKI